MPAPSKDHGCTTRPIHLPVFPVTAAGDALQQSLAFGVTTSIVMGDVEYYGRQLPTLDEASVAALATAAHARARIAVAHIADERYARSAIRS